MPPPRRSGGVETRPREFGGAAVSVAAHAALVAAMLMMMPRLPVLDIRSPPPLIVDLVPPPPADAAGSRPATAAAPADTPVNPDMAAAGGLHHAARILSGGALDGVARASLASISPGSRIEQLCGVEALEQIAAGDAHYVPERVIAYLDAATRFDGATLVADGAAFQSAGHWFRLRFRCRTSAGGEVVAFDFAVGDAIADSDPRLPGSGAGDEASDEN